MLLHGRKYNLKSRHKGETSIYHCPKNYIKIKMSKKLSPSVLSHLAAKLQSSLMSLAEKLHSADIDKHVIAVNSVRVDAGGHAVPPRDAALSLDDALDIFKIDVRSITNQLSEDDVIRISILKIETNILGLVPMLRIPMIIPPHSDASVSPAKTNSSLGLSDCDVEEERFDAPFDQSYYECRTSITIDDKTFVVEADDLEKNCDLGRGTYGVEKMYHRHYFVVLRKWNFNSVK